MGLFMMVASATWGHAGAFTPFYRIAAVLDRAAFDISLEQAATGSRFWFEPQTALPGVCVHLALAAVFGVVFVLLAHEGRGARPLALLLAGAAWGVVVAAVMVPVLRLAGRSAGETWWRRCRGSSAGRRTWACTWSTGSPWGPWWRCGPPAGVPERPV